MALAQALRSARLLPDGLDTTHLDSFFDQLLAHPNVNEKDMLTVVGEVLSIPFKPLSDIVFDPACPPLPKSLRSGSAIPVFQDQNIFCLAVNNPYMPELKALKTEFPNHQIKLILIGQNDLSEFYGSTETLIHTGSESLDRLLRPAYAKQASDIHLLNQPVGMDVTFRIHGQLVKQKSIPPAEKAPLIQFIKLHSHMDISNHVYPQDGRLHFQAGNQDHQIRVASIPTVNGEDLVLRLYQKSVVSDWDKLGFSQKAQEWITTMLTKNAGLILVTGPTGSGKTTTLYAMLSQLLKRGLRIVTLEDPVETTIEHIRQCQINLQSGFTYEAGLKALLRQDPDIIMLGEIRDRTIAKIALEAAYTGHLVLSSLHTSDVQSTLMRLASFNLDPFLVGSCLKGIVSQQLVPNYTKNGRSLLSEILSIQRPALVSEWHPLNQALLSQPLLSFEEDLNLKKRDRQVDSTFL